MIPCNEPRILLKALRFILHFDEDNICLTTIAKRPLDIRSVRDKENTNKLNDETNAPHIY